VPFFIANKLSTNQRFEEALEWFHYIFDPTCTDTATPNPDTPQQKYWITKKFYETTKSGLLRAEDRNLLLAIAKGETEVRAQVKNGVITHLIRTLLLECVGCLPEKCTY